MLTFQKVCLSVRDIGNRSVQRQSEGEFLATDLEGLDTMWEHRMLSIWRKCVRLRWWEEIKNTRGEKQMFSVQTACSDTPCLHRACEAAILLREEKHKVKLYIYSHTGSGRV